MKQFAFFLVFALAALIGNAQNQKIQIDKNNPELKRLEEKAAQRAKGQQKQLSPYDVKNRNIALRPMMPICRDVSQFDTIDNGTIRILYALNAVDIANPQTYDDLQRLEIGSNYTKYYGYYVYQADSCVTYEGMEFNRILGTNFSIEGDNIQITMRINGKFQGWSQYLFSEYYKDLTKNELTEYCRMPNALKRYDSYYTESMPTQEWQMTEETQEIAGYQCQKATCEFRGRHYTAWFAVDIPISQGPWKFGGLPGLILKVYDDKQEYVFECVGIEQHAQAFPIILLDNYKDYRKTTRSKLDKLLKSVCENYYQVSGLTNTISKKLLPYNPMELE